MICPRILIVLACFITNIIFASLQLYMCLMMNLILWKELAVLHFRALQVMLNSSTYIFLIVQPFDKRESTMIYTHRVLNCFLALWNASKHIIDDNQWLFVISALTHYGYQYVVTGETGQSTQLPPKKKKNVVIPRMVTCLTTLHVLVAVAFEKHNLKQSEAQFW